MRAHLFAVTWCCSLILCASGCAPGILWACARPEVTAISLNPCDGDHCGKESGIPFYLPKPLLIVSKNFRNIETPTVGLTDTAPIPVGYDDQSKYADLNARTNFNGLNGTAGTGGAGADPANPSVNTGSAVKSAPTLHSNGAPITPGKAPSDGLAPETFFTYQIVFVPDMTKRYGLKIRGGPGEIRAAMNLVNGWQFTGIGPFYMKDSSTAQNILASGISTRLGGAAAADVLNASANLAKAFPGGARQGGAVPADDERVQRLSETIGQLPLNMTPMTLVDFAEIHVYEPHLTPDGQMVWTEIVNLHFNRDYLGEKKIEKFYAPKAPATPPVPAKGGLQGAAVGGITDDPVARAAVAGIFGLKADSPALRTVTGERQGGAVGATGALPTGGVNQIQVDCGGAAKCGQAKEFNIFRFGDWAGWHKTQRPKIETRSVTAVPVAVPGIDVLSAAPFDPTKSPTPGGGLQGGAVGGTPSAAPPTTIINQPIFNQPAATVVPAPKATPPSSREE